MEEVTAEDSDTENEGDAEGDNKTPVIDDETTPEEEVVETPEETPEEDSEEAPAATTMESAEINAVEDTESTISVEYKNADEQKDGKDVDGKESDAEVVFLGGCVSSDKKLAKDRDLRFKVEPAAGRVVTKVEQQIGEATSGTPITADASGVYTVGKASFVVSEKAVSGKIIITTKAVNYKVSFAAEEGGLSTYTIYPVVAKSAEDSTKVLGTAVSDPADLVYGKSGEFAIVVTGAVNKLVSITLSGEEIKTTAAELNLQTDDATAEKTKCFTFTVDPSKVEGLKDATESDKAAQVKVKVVAKAKLTVAFDDNNVNSTPAGVASPTATQINYTENKFGDDSTFVEDDDANLAKSLAFKVTPDTNYKVTDVTAKATTEANTEGTAVTVTKGAAAADGSVECTIALSQVKGFSVDTTLTISIATELDTTKDAVHVINFKSAAGSSLDNVKITDEADAELEDVSLTVTDDTYVVKVAPKKGYELAKGTKTEEPDKNNDKYVVTVAESRVYAGITAPKTVSTEVEAVGPDGAAKAITLKLKDAVGDKLYEGGNADGAENKAYVVKSVDITINATVMKNNAEKLVKFTDDLGAGYKITTEGVIRNEEADEEDLADSWVIPATVDVLTFTVTSAKEPAVTVGDAEVNGTVADGVYTYSYPAAALAAGTTPTDIVISDNSKVVKKAVKVKVDPEDVTVEYDETAVDFDTLGAPDADDYYTIDTAAIVGKEIELTFRPNDGVAIDKVSYTMGEEKGNGIVDNRDKSVSLTLTVTDTVIVDVESKSDYRVVLTDKDGNALKKDGDAYVADYTDENIGIELTKAGVTYTGNLYDVVVKDGAKTAATEAKVNDNGSTAAIAKIAESERGKDLTIEVYINKNTKYTTTLKTNIVSEEVTVSRTVNGKDTKVAEDATVDIMPDAAMAFTVTPAKGASLSDLAVEILAKDGAALTAETSPIASSSFANGTLSVTTKPGAAKDTEVLVSIYNTNAEKKDGKNVSLKGGKFVLKLTDPLVKSAEISKVNAAAGSATNRAVRLNVSVDFKNKKNPPAAPIQGDLYYKVDFTAPTGAPANVTVIPATTKYVKVDDYANTAETIELALVTANTEDKAATEETAAVIADIAEQISTTAKVTLVQSLSTKDLETEAVTDADYVAGPEAAMKDSTLTTKKPVYETKLSVKTVNGATVFTGQSDATVATPVFGKDTSYDNITVQFVDTKTGVLRGDEGSDEEHAAVYGSYFYAWVAADNSIHVGIMDEDGDVYASSYKTLGVKVTAAGPDDSYKASAVVKLKVQQGIYSVYRDESKAKLPDTIYKDPKKAASVKITPLLNWGSKEQKPAKANVTWEIAPYLGDRASSYAKAAVTGKKPLVSVKNGTVSIAKDYQVQTADVDNKFTVTIRANDFAGNGESTYHEYDFEITDRKAEISKLVIMDCYGDIVEKDPSSLTAEDFDYWDHEYNTGNDYEKYLYVAAQDAKGNEIPVTFKSSNAKALAVGTASGLLTFSKPADKIKITATTVDGGKAPKAELVINVKPYKEIGLFIDGVESSTGLDETDIHYSGGSNEKYTLSAAYKKGNVWFGTTAYKNLKVTVKGGKFVANNSWSKYSTTNIMGSAVVVTDKSGKATVTVTDTANKDKATNHKDYIITNDNPTAVKAPSIKLYDPKKVALGTEAITWQVTDKNNDNYAGSYVKLTPDFTVTASNPASNIVSSKGTVLKINENGRFTLDRYISYTGAYKMVATVGTMVGGEFVASAKDVKLSFNISAKKYKTNLTVKNSYTLDAKSASTARIDVKSDYNYEISNAMNVMKKVQGKNDHTNAFTTYFEVKPLTYADEYDVEHVYAYTIGLKPGLSAEQIEYITSKDGKNDCTGYITVSNGYGTIGSLYSRLNTKDVQVKISFKANKYSLTGATIFSNGAATTTPVTATVRLMNGKIRDYAALVAVDAADDGRFVAATNPISFNNGDIVITSKAAAIEPGKYDVKLIVVPQSSGFVKWDETTQKWIYANDKTEGGKTLTDAELIAKAGIPVTAKIDVKAVDTKSIAKAKNLNVTLSTQLYADSNGNGYVQATSTTGGYYQVDVPYSIAITGSDISATAGDVKVNLTDKAGVNQNEITVAANTKEELVKAAKAVGYDSDGNEIPVIRLQVSKKALVALNGMDKKDKPITAYGKKLKVPVAIKYTNGITTTDTLNFNITMPKKAPADFEGIQTIIADNQAVIEKIQTRLAGTAQVELTLLLNDVCNKVRGLVPADTDVRVSYLVAKKYLNDGEKVEAAEEADTPDYDGIMDAGKAKITLTLTDLTKASASTKDVSFTYTLGMNAKDDDLETVKSAIVTFGAGYTFTNDTTAATLLADIKADDTVKELLGARKGHLSLKVSSFDKTPATTTAAGTFKARIQVKDLVTGSTETAIVGSNGNIRQLNNLTQAKTAVSTFFTDAKVKDLVNNCSGQEAAIKAAILKAANEKAGNKDITIDFKADTATTKGWNYEKPEAAVMEENGSDVKTPAKAGKISFTLVLTKAQADGSRSAEVAVDEIEIDAENAEKYLAPVDMKKKVDAAITADKLKALAQSKDNNGGAIKTALEEQFEALTGAVEGYTLTWAKKAGSKTEEPDFTYEPATQEKAAKLSFKVVLTLVGAGTSETISVEVADALAKADKYQTAAELKAKIEAMSKTIESTVAVTDANADDMIRTEAEKLIGKDSELTVTVTRATGNEDATKNSVFTAAGEGTDASLTNVTITIDDDNKVTVEKFTFKVTSATTP